VRAVEPLAQLALGDEGSAVLATIRADLDVRVGRLGLATPAAAGAAA